MAEPVLLTGATGFVGRAVLAELVARGIPVHAVSRRPVAAVQCDGVIWHEADLLTDAGRAKVARLAPRLLHCAWEVEHGTFWTSPANAIWHAASVDMARRFRAAGGDRILALGTCAEYDATAPGPWTENRPLRPDTPYGKAKLALFHDLSDLCGDDLTWARLFHLFGPGEDARRLIPSLCLRLASGQPATVNAPDLIRDYAPTAHIARCLGLLLDGDVRGACDVGSGSPASLGQLATWIAEALGATDLLRLSPLKSVTNPTVMAPDLDRLRENAGLVPIDLKAALIGFVKHREGLPLLDCRTRP